MLSLDLYGEYLQVPKSTEVATLKQKMNMFDQIPKIKNGQNWSKHDKPTLNMRKWWMRILNITQSFFSDWNQF